MAEFLDTTAVSDRLSQLIKHAKDRIILISPYLKINDRLKEFLEDQNRMKIDIRVIYGKSELKPAEIKWLQTLDYVHTSFHKNLHAKCYMSESEAIITSMNLYEFSQVNNEEMGIHVSLDDDPDLYQTILDEAQRLIRNADEIKVSVMRVHTPPPKTTLKSGEKPVSLKSGVCIRCGKSIPLDPTHPYCKDDYRIWKKFGNNDFKEKYCHICGKDHPATFSKPADFACYNDNKSKLQFPLAS